VKVRSAALYGDIDNCTSAPAVFRAVVRCQNAKLGDRIRVDVHEVISAAAVVLVVSAIQIPGEGIRPAPVDRLAAVVYSVAAEQAESAVIGG